jgi:hypothetical protein
MNLQLHSLLASVGAALAFENNDLVENSTHTLRINIITYYLTIDPISDLDHVLEVKTENGETIYKVVIYVSIEEDVFFNLFALIRKRNQILDTIAFLHIPDDWSEEEYIDFFQVFNHDAGADNHFNHYNKGINIIIG